MEKIKFLCVVPHWTPVVLVWVPGRKAFWAELSYSAGRPQATKVQVVLDDAPYLFDEYDSPELAIAAVPQKANDSESPFVLAFASLDAVAHYLRVKGDLMEI